MIRKLGLSTYVADKLRVVVLNDWATDKIGAWREINQSRIYRAGPAMSAASAAICDCMIDSLYTKVRPKEGCGIVSVILTSVIGDTVAWTS